FQGAFYCLPEVGGTPSRQTAVVMAPGVMISYFFNLKKPATASSWQAAVEASSPPRVTVGVRPSRAILLASPTQHFYGSVTGAPRAKLFWTLKPKVGRSEERRV